MNAIEKLSAVMDCSPSELLKNLLIEKTNELEGKGIKTGLIVK